MFTNSHLHLPSPTYPLRPPRFLTRNIPDFLSPQFIDNPKSVSKTHVQLTCFHVIPANNQLENKILLLNFGNKYNIEFEILISISCINYYCKNKVKYMFDNIFTY